MRCAYPQLSELLASLSHDTSRDFLVASSQDSEQSRLKLDLPSCRWRARNGLTVNGRAHPHLQPRISQAGASPHTVLRNQTEAAHSPHSANLMTSTVVDRSRSRSTPQRQQISVVSFHRPEHECDILGGRVCMSPRWSCVGTTCSADVQTQRCARMRCVVLQWGKILIGSRNSNYDASTSTLV